MSLRAAACWFVGFAIGAVLGVLGIVVTRMNEKHFGAMYSAYRYEWLAIPSLPGQLAAESGVDWQFGEWWFHRYEILLWNVILWGMTGLAAVVAWNYRAR